MCALPLFHALREAYPAAEIGWALQGEFAGLIEPLPGLQRVFRFDRRGGLGAWRRLRRELRAFGADWAVDAQGNLKSAAATWCSGAARRVGLAPEEWRERLGARVLTDAAPPSGEAHAVARTRALARYVAPAEDAPRFDPGLSEAERALGREELGRLLAGPADGVRVLYLGRERDVRAWAPGSFEQIARRLSAAGTPVLVISGPHEEGDGLLLARRLAGSGAGHWVGQRDLRRLAAVLAAAAEAGGALLACDSGPMHLACSVGLRTVCLHGPTDPARTGPWTPGGVSPATALRARSAPDCAPCLARRCTHPQGPVCMSGIAVEDALVALTAD